jgi:hypothetical protein
MFALIVHYFITEARADNDDEFWKFLYVDTNEVIVSMHIDKNNFKFLIISYNTKKK